MSSIGSVGSPSTSMMGMPPMKRPEPAEIAANLFTQLDTEGQGYIEAADLQSAFDKIGSGDDTSNDTQALFATLDGDSDGKLTRDEFTRSMERVAEQLDAQFMNLRMQEGTNGMGGMAPPPPPGSDGQDNGYTKDELTRQLEEIGSTDSRRSSLIASVVENFDRADADGNGRVTFVEAMAFDSSQEGNTADSTRATDGNAEATNSVAASSANMADMGDELLRQIMALMKAYAPVETRDASNAASRLSATA